MVQAKPVIPDLKVNIQIEWTCPHCNVFNRSKGFVALDIITINCSVCKKPVDIDCRLAFDKRGL